MRAVLIIFLLAGFCLGWCGAARAHAVLLETVPSDRSVSAQSLDIVILRFNETVRPITVELRDASAARVAVEIISVDHEIRVAPRVALMPGAYFLSYRVTSADSHPVAGSVLFAVGAAPAEWAEPTVSGGTYTAWTWAVAINRSVFLTALFVAMGGWIYAFIVRQGSPPYRLIWRAAAFGAASAIAGIYLQGGVLLEPNDVTPWNGEIWRIGLSSTRGVALFVAAIGLLICVTPSRMIAGIGLATIIASFALSGHAATASPRWIALPALVLHIAVAAFWLGSLAPLLAALDRARSERRTIFHRFSEAAVLIVPQLLLAGAILSILQIQQFDAFLGTAYGLLLALKLCFVGLLAVIGACNRWILIPEMRDDIEGHVGRFRFAIRAQLGLGIAVLGSTAFLSQTVPPRTIFEHEAAQIEATRTAGQTILIAARERKALLAVTPARPGRNTIRVRVLSGDDRAIQPLEVWVDLSNPAAGIEPLRRKLTARDDGYFDHIGPELAVAGHWTVRIDALINDFEQSVFETEIAVK